VVPAGTRQDMADENELAEHARATLVTEGFRLSDAPPVVTWTPITRENAVFFAHLGAGLGDWWYRVVFREQPDDTRQACSRCQNGNHCGGCYCCG